MKNEIKHLGASGGRLVKRLRDLQDGGSDVLLDYRPVSDLSLGTKIGATRVHEAGQSGNVVTTSKRPGAVVVGPPPQGEVGERVWNLNDGTTLDESEFDQFLAGELTTEEAEAIIGGALPRSLTLRKRRV